ncbi:glycosyltransferase [Acaryochloris sp. IP29b_bin.148]|uniref:glycosyltransferase n=1 Tax=Acaryochloris sp. IP29b_bin.148 TaxID=2969218 RepID=UPI0026028C46|nr:glycosyltransferase [Acaryochloris sp. IP29b_bin.148]
MSPPPAVAIFCGRLLPISETFIHKQAEGLQSFRPHYVGTRFVQGISLPQERTQVVNRGGLLGIGAELLFKELGISPSLSRRVHQIDPVLMHAHFGVCGTLALPLANRLHIPLVVTYHGLDATMSDQFARQNSISTRVYLRRRETLKAKVQLFLCVSEFIKNKLINQGFPEDRLLVHYIGVDTNLYQADITANRQLIVLFNGRLIEKKGCEYLIKAMKWVKDSVADASLIIIGDGPLRKELEHLAANTLKCYQFLGSQPSHVVREWMKKARLLVVPSVTSDVGDSEGLPMVILEAQAMGVPIVASDHGGIPEAIIHGKTGFLVPEHHCQYLAQHILYLLQNSMLCQEFSANGRKQVLIKFDLYQQTRTLEQIYSTFVKKH